MMLFVITGASRGIGAALARAIRSRFGDRATLLLVARTRSRLEDLSAELGPPCMILPADLSDPVAFGDSLRASLAGLSPDSFNRITLVNNAGVLGPIGPAGSNAPSEIAGNISVNLTAALVASEVFLSWAQSVHSDKTILNVSSGAARFPIVSWGAYCAAKAGLDMFSRVLEAEDHPGLRIVSVAPGIIETDMQRSIRDVPTERFPLRDDFVRYKETGKLKSVAQAADELMAILENPKAYEVLTSL